MGGAEMWRSSVEERLLFAGARLLVACVDEITTCRRQDV